MRKSGCHDRDAVGVSRFDGLVVQGHDVRPLSSTYRRRSRMPVSHRLIPLSKLLLLQHNRIILILLSDLQRIEIAIFKNLFRHYSKFDFKLFSKD